MKQNKDDYNEEPVYYCSRCLSLAIKADIDDFCYCDKCGSTQIEQCDIFHWEALYRDRYRVDFRRHN